MFRIKIIKMVGKTYDNINQWTISDRKGASILLLGAYHKNNMEKFAHVQNAKKEMGVGLARKLLTKHGSTIQGVVR